MKLINYNNFAKFRKSTAILVSLWRRAFPKLYKQVAHEWTTQLIDYQLKVTKEFEHGELREQLLTVLMVCHPQIYSRQRIPQMEVMTCIEKVF